MTRGDARDRRDDDAPVDLTPLLRDSPPDELRRAVCTALSERGDFRPAGRGPGPMAAAAILLVAAGFGVGVAWGRRAAGGAERADAGLAQPAEGAAEAGAAPIWALVLLGGPRYEAPADSAEAERRVAELARWAASLAEAGRLVFAEELGPPAALLPAEATAGAPPLGLFVIRAADATEATGIARRSPHVLHGGRVAVQPIIAH